MNSQTYVLLDESGCVVNRIIADEAFINELSSMIDDSAVDTSTSVTKKAILLDASSEGIGIGWKNKSDNTWEPPKGPTEEELVVLEDRNDSRMEEEQRLLELRSKVGKDKSGLTQDERDELNLILATRNINSI